MYVDKATKSMYVCVKWSYESAEAVKMNDSSRHQARIKIDDGAFGNNKRHSLRPVMLSRFFLL